MAGANSEKGFPHELGEAEDLRLPELFLCERGMKGQSSGISDEFGDVCDAR